MTTRSKTRKPADILAGPVSLDEVEALNAALDAAAEPFRKAAAKAAAAKAEADAAKSAAAAALDDLTDRLASGDDSVSTDDLLRAEADLKRADLLLSAASAKAAQAANAVPFAGPLDAAVELVNVLTEYTDARAWDMAVDHKVRHDVPASVIESSRPLIVVSQVREPERNYGNGTMSAPRGSLVVTVWGVAAWTAKPSFVPAAYATADERVAQFDARARVRFDHPHTSPVEVDGIECARTEYGVAVHMLRAPVPVLNTYATRPEAFDQPSRDRACLLDLESAVRRVFDPRGADAFHDRAQVQAVDSVETRRDTRDDEDGRTLLRRTYRTTIQARIPQRVEARRGLILADVLADALDALPGSTRSLGRVESLKVLKGGEGSTSLPTPARSWVMDYESRTTLDPRGALVWREVEFTTLVEVAA